MTDDRARRIREIRNRTTTDGSDDEDSSDPDGSDGGSESTSQSETDAESASQSETDAESTSQSDTETESAPETDAESTSQPTDDSASSTDDVSAASDGEGSSTAAVDEDEAETETGRQSPESETETESQQDTAVSGDEPDAASTEAEPAENGSVSDASSASSSASTGVAAAGTASSGEQTVGTAVSAVSDDSDGVVEASLQGAIAGMSDTVTVDERVGEATVDATAIAQRSDTYGEAAAGREQVFDRGDSLIASTNEEDTVQMLEFFLDEDRYAIEIERISAIVEMKEITRFPRGPTAIDGVTDLRGEITGVLDPTAMLDIDRNEPSDDHYIVVLEREGDKQKLGIRVTDVSQAVTYRESQIDETGAVMDNDSGDHEFVEGIVKKEVEDGTELIAWLDVDDLIDDIEMQYSPGEKYSEQRL